MSSELFRNIEQSPLKRLLTEQEVATALGVTDRHLRNLRTRRVIPYIKLGKAVRYCEADVAEAITSHLTVHALTVSGKSPACGLAAVEHRSRDSVPGASATVVPLPGLRARGLEPRIV